MISDSGSLELEFSWLHSSRDGVCIGKKDNVGAGVSAESGNKSFLKNNIADLCLSLSSQVCVTWLPLSMAKKNDLSDS